jgi:hypothetical protein
MRHWILKLHLYSSLLCSSYLVIFGFTSLNFNHRFDFMAQQDDVVSRQEQSMNFDTSLKNVPLAESIRDQFGLFGFAPAWRMKRQDNGDLDFWLNRPVKQYHIIAQADIQRVSIETHYRNPWSAVQALHAMRRLPGSTFASVWGVYLEVSTIVVLFAALSGLYLWLPLAARSRATLFATIIASSLSIVLMVYIYYWG